MNNPMVIAFLSFFMGVLYTLALRPPPKPPIEIKLIVPPGWSEVLPPLRVQVLPPDAEGPTFGKEWAAPIPPDVVDYISQESEEHARQSREHHFKTLRAKLGTNEAAFAALQREDGTSFDAGPDRMTG